MSTMQQSCRLERLTYYSVVGFKLRTCQQDTPGTFDEIKVIAHIAKTHVQAAEKL